MNEKIKNILSVYVLRLQWLIYDLKTCSLNEDPITLHLTGGDITISLNPKTKTTMNRQQAKEFLPIIQAFAEGKTIQFLSLTETEEWWRDIQYDKNVEFNYPPSRYRIKPEPKYRPFNDAEECWQEMLKHQPFGWLREKKRNVHTQIGFMYTEGIQGTSGGSSTYKAFFDCFNFADGTPFGIKE